MVSCIGDVFKQHILDAASRCLAVFLVIKNAQVYQLPLAEVFDADVFEANITYA